MWQETGEFIGKQEALQVSRSANPLVIQRISIPRRAFLLATWMVLTEEFRAARSTR
jgi:hypothetical protein